MRAIRCSIPNAEGRTRLGVSGISGSGGTRKGRNTTCVGVGGISGSGCTRKCARLRPNQHHGLAVVGGRSERHRLPLLLETSVRMSRFRHLDGKGAQEFCRHALWRRDQRPPARATPRSSCEETYFTPTASIIKCLLLMSAAVKFEPNVIRSRFDDRSLVNDTLSGMGQVRQRPKRKVLVPEPLNQYS